MLFCFDGALLLLCPFIAYANLPEVVEPSEAEKQQHRSTHCAIQGMVYSQREIRSDCLHSAAHTRRDPSFQIFSYSRDKDGEAKWVTAVGGENQPVPRHGARTYLVAEMNRLTSLLGRNEILNDPEPVCKTLTAAIIRNQN